MNPESQVSTGHFCWCELVCPDPAGAAAFYDELFGWQHRIEQPGSGDGYTVFALGGRDVAGAATPGGEDGPARWLCYVMSDDADRDAAAAADNGGRLITGPVEIPAMGRFAVVSDPAGAVFGLWQGERAALPWPREPGFPCWLELRTADAGVASFYADTLGWRTETRRYDRDYTVFFLGDEAVASTDGALPDTADHWLPYFAVASCDAALARATALGATVRIPVTAVPGLGSYAVLMDPCGAGFALKQDL